VREQDVDRRGFAERALRRAEAARAQLAARVAFLRLAAAALARGWAGAGAAPAPAPKSVV
jgi:hypothetical protein